MDLSKRQRRFVNGFYSGALEKEPLPKNEATTWYRLGYLTGTVAQGVATALSALAAYVAARYMGMGGA
mgnify:FL=1